MGIVHVHRGRLALALFLTLAALLVLGASRVTEPANAQRTFTACASCHDYAFNDDFHNATTHALQSCAKCHPDGASKPPAPSACASCHGGTTAILAGDGHVAGACGTTPGCHGVPLPATTVSLKVAPKTIKLRKTVTASGKTTPAATLAGKTVALKAEIKKGKKWVKAKSGSAKVSAGGAFSWKYKPAKKGSYRVTASVAASATYKASKSKAMTFTVK